jgi:hypothetical protein
MLKREAITSNYMVSEEGAYLMTRVVKKRLSSLLPAKKE